MVNSISNKRNVRNSMARKLVKENYVYDTNWVKYGIPSTEELLDDYETFKDSYFECFDDYTSNGYHIIIKVEDSMFIIALFNENDHTENVSTFTASEVKEEGIGRILNELNYYAYPSNDYELDEKCNKRRPSRVSKKSVKKESRNARRTNRRLKEWFNPTVAVEDLTSALEIINSVATNAQRSDDFSSAKPITAVATQLKSVINSLKIK